MLTLEQVEVHISYLRQGMEKANSVLPELLHKLEKLSEKMDAKIDQANRDRAAGDTALAEKINQANKDRNAADNVLAAKIDLAHKDRGQ